MLMLGRQAILHLFEKEVHVDRGKSEVPLLVAPQMMMGDR